MRLIFVNRFYWPETPATGQLLTDLAEALARDGHEVTVIASRGAAALAAREEHHGVRLVRVRSVRLDHGGLPGKAIALASFYLGATWRMLRETRRGSILVALTDPPLIGIAAWLVAALRGARLVHWVQDIYPELAMELAGQRWLAVLRPLRNAAWRGAARCAVLGSDMARVLEHARVPAPRIALAPNWAPAGVAPAERAAIAALHAAWHLAGKFIVAYSGNLGRVHDLMPVLELAAAVAADPRIAFVFVGAGAQRAALEAEARRRALGHVHFFPAQPRDRLSATLAAGDAHLVTLLPGCERLVFPSKLYGIAAVGRPVLFIGPTDCELARLVREKRFGAAADRSDIATLAATLQAWAGDPVTRANLGRNALAFAAENDAAHGTARWRALLHEVQAC